MASGRTQRERERDRDDGIEQIGKALDRLGGAQAEEVLARVLLGYMLQNGAYSTMVGVVGEALILLQRFDAGPDAESYLAPIFRVSEALSGERGSYEKRRPWSPPSPGMVPNHHPPLTSPYQFRDENGIVRSLVVPEDATDEEREEIAYRARFRDRGAHLARAIKAMVTAGEREEAAEIALYYVGAEEMQDALREHAELRRNPDNEPPRLPAPGTPLVSNRNRRT